MLKEDKGIGCLSYKIKEVKFPALCTPTRHLIFTKIHYLVIHIHLLGPFVFPIILIVHISLLLELSGQTFDLCKWSVFPQTKNAQMIPNILLLSSLPVFLPF